MVSIDSLSSLPIDVAEAMYSPDFVELSTLGGGGTPVVLPMSFTLDVGGNVVRFSSPLAAGRLANLGRDPRCCVSFTRVTSGYPPVVLQGVATLGEVTEGVRRGPAQRFTVAPVRLYVVDSTAAGWQFPPPAVAVTSQPATAAAPRPPRSTVTPEDLDAITRFETTVVGLRDRDGWPLNSPAEIERDGDVLIVHLPAALADEAGDGPASLLGHTWTKDGPRYLAVTCRASRDRSALRCQPIRALRRL